MVPIQVLLKRVLPLGALVAMVMTLFGSFAIAHAAGGATFQDNAGLFTSAGRSRINQAAQSTGLNVLVLTNAQPFSGDSAWHSYVQQHAGGAGTITIGLHINPKKAYVYTGSSTGISESQAYQAYQNALPTFNNHTSSATSDGVAQLIQNLKGAGAIAPGGAPAAAPSRGIGGVIVPLIILALLAFVLMRVLGRRRRNTVMPGYGPGYGQPPMGQGPYNQGQGGYPNQGFGNQGNRGGGFGRGLLGGVAGGLAGSFIGNEIFGNRGEGGNANAAGPDAGANAPGDTANAQDQQGGWGGDSGVSGDSGGGWGGGGDAGGGWGGDSGGGWGGDSGGGGGGDSGGGWS